MNRYSIGNIVLFVVLSVAVLGGWWLVETYLIPKPPPPTRPEPKPLMPARETVLALAGGAVGGSADLAEWPSRFRPLAAKPPEKPPEPPKPSEPHRLIGLSGEGYNLQVLLTNRGAGVQQVELPTFDHAGRDGRRAIDEETKKPYPLELIPGYYRKLDKSSVLKDGPHRRLAPTPPGQSEPLEGLTEPSYTLLHYAPDETNASAPRPSNELAMSTWQVVKAGDGREVTVRTDAGGAETEREVMFETTLGAPYHVRIRKTFTLAKTDFHVRMKLDFFATADRPAKAPKFQYQISGPRNVPVEGEWYAQTLRNALVGWKTSNGYARRDIQEAARITAEHGGYKVEPQGNTFTYAAVVSQFFAAAVAIDPSQPEDVRKGLWAYVRPTREWDRHLDLNETPQSREAFYRDKPQLGDITVRAVANPIDPNSTDKPVEHKYWLYHGPTKVRLLKTLHLLDDEHQGFDTNPELVDNQYIDALGLNTMTDAPSPNWFGTFARTIGWTDLVVWFTNRMHDVLGWMHKLVPLWMVNIVMLTVLVRLLLLVPSRRQQAGMLKMQEKMAAMKPELDKVQERFKNDPQRLNQEKTKLMLQHGVNPLTSMGGCLLMFAQMPVFLGLYYCLQESIFFRLHGSPWWIPNLAAPDMLFSWSESIPFISTADQIGHSWYLGPFFNLLPVIAVTLMYINFKISSPPPTDEQQEMQQKMMKFMMIFMGVFFYKMAAGLCIYFTCSTAWGMTERWMLKRKQKKAEGDADAATPPATSGPTALPAKPAGPPKPPGFLERVKQGLMEKLEEAQKQAETSRQIVNERKPPDGPPTPGANGPAQGKKKRRKK
ncbi:MAG: YidC/Oxa1 family membrane protein insertase [Fimbriiglobus sp.]|nr:YidC/Oxa1 family membrane protein insertase [Fimbriiglobus sp.]